MGRPTSDKRERILAAATRLFSTQSLSQVKLDQVAKAAGTAKGTIYLYFHDKNDLFYQCLTNDADFILAQAEKIIKGPGSISDRLLQLIELQAQTFARKGPIIQQMIQMGPNFPLAKQFIKRLRSHLESVIDLHTILFQEGIDKKFFTAPLSARQMAIIFIQIFDLNVKFQMFNVPLLTPKEVHAALIKLFTK